jgi:hypothetical protein
MVQKGQADCMQAPILERIQEISERGCPEGQIVELRSRGLYRYLYFSYDEKHRRSILR